MEKNNIIEWTPASMLEVTLNEPDDFLKVRETLTRIGVASRKENILKNCFYWMAKNLILKKMI